MADQLELPRRLVDAAAEDRTDERRDWIARLPGLVAELTERWRLSVGAPYQPGGQTAWVAPVRTADGHALVLKVGWRHWEAEREADGLRLWAGRGAVLLHEAMVDGDTSALLLEKCAAGHDLTSCPAREQDEVIAALLRQLWVEPPAGHPFRPLAEMCTAWADSSAADPCRDLDPGLVRTGVELFRALPASADHQSLLVTDLHAENVLAAQRQPWLVIDPKPWYGDRAYDPLQHMLNHVERLTADGRGLAHRMADLCGLDRERLSLWLFARCVVESSWSPHFAPIAVALAP